MEYFLSQESIDLYSRVDNMANLPEPVTLARIDDSFVVEMTSFEFADDNKGLLSAYHGIVRALHDEQWCFDRIDEVDR